MREGDRRGRWSGGRDGRRNDVGSGHVEVGERSVFGGSKRFERNGRRFERGGTGDITIPKLGRLGSTNRISRNEQRIRCSEAGVVIFQWGGIGRTS